jgi:hypothetical protein
MQDLRLKGLHSLAFVDEVALISVPDAVQPSWSDQGGGLAVSSSPPPPPPGPPAGFADCGSPLMPQSLAPTSGPVDGGTAVTITGSGFSPGTGVTFGGRAADQVRVIDATTLTCVTPRSAAGKVAVAITAGGSSATLGDAFFYYVRLPVAASSAPLPTAVDSDASAADRLQTIHTALIRLCEARSDAVAILALPSSFEKPDCEGWLQTLRGSLHLPARGGRLADAREIADLSYAAVYHPWLLVPDADGPSGALRPVPPDGAACGAVAAREIERGVWVAPANVPLSGVLDLQPAFSDDDWADLFALQFNLVRQQAKDFRLMSAHTLADDQSLLQLSVRRLLIQLRKAALERGQDHVFEPNDEQLRQTVRLRLEDLLRSMFERGAFAGKTQPDSYRITVDDSVNTAADIDQGRLIAQILVAPSRPMEFITVLLTRTGAGLLQSSEG